MKTAAKIMYIIGRIGNIIELVCGVILFISGIVALAGGSISAVSSSDNEQLAAVFASGTSLIIFGILLFVISLVVLILSKKGINALKNNTVENAPHIVMIVIGAISQNYFYILGGIFALIGEHM